MAVVAVGELPEDAVEAAAEFHSRILPDMLARACPMQDDDHLALIFPPAPHDHQAWRLAAVQGLARRAAPSRVNAVEGDDNAAIAEALHFLHHAPGVTGQILAVDGKTRENR